MNDATDSKPTSEAGNPRGDEFRMDLGLFAVSACVLTLQVLQTKIFAYSLDPLSIYLAIGICMLGLGASATLLAVLPAPPPARVRGIASAFAVASALAVVVAHIAFAKIAPSFADWNAGSIFVLVALALPYLLFGVAIALLLVARSAAIGRAYAFNLAGSGLGCAIVFPLLDALGAERALVAVAAMALLAALVICHWRPASLIAIGASAMGLTAAFAMAPTWLDFPPERTGQLARVLEEAARIEAQHPGSRVRGKHIFGRWDRTARVDVYQLESSIPALQSRPVESLFFVQDSSAGSFLLGVHGDLDSARPFFDRTVYGAGYARRKRPEKVLVIGLGGAPDILAALLYKAKRIVGAEINQTTIDLVRERFAEHLGHPYQQPGVEILRVDGRAFLRSSSEKFDLIQMSGADTKSTFAAGALAVNENYLYTREAMREILRRLRDDGMVVINRFGNLDIHRLATLAVEGLRDEGATMPERHLVAIEQGLWRALLVRRTPFPASELDQLKAWVRAGGGEPPDIVMPHYDWIGVSFQYPMQLMYSPVPRPAAKTPYFRGLLAGRVDEVVANERVFDLRAPTDDRPFFFFPTRPAAALRGAFLPTAPGDWSRYGGLILQRIHGAVSQLAGISALFILAPLVALRRRGLRAPGAGSALTYFACLGAGFMLIEIGLIQHFVLLLGHQSYAISVVIFGLLVGASIGSALSARLDLSTRSPVRMALAGVIVLLISYGVSLAGLFEYAAPAGFPARLTLALALLVLLGGFLGVPFPAGMRALRSSSVPFVAWGIGVNGFASVVASTLAVEIAMLAGLRVLLLLAAFLYCVALWLAPTETRAGAPLADT